MIDCRDIELEKKGEAPLRKWQVKKIEILDDGARVTFAQGRHEQTFYTDRFGVGECKAKCAALARFAAKCGLGKVRETFKFLHVLPEDYRGRLLLPSMLEPARCHKKGVEAS